MRVRLKAVQAKAISPLTLLSPRKRTLRMPRCSFSTPKTGSTSA
jgi:hypothetical protein